MAGEAKAMRERVIADGRSATLFAPRPRWHPDWLQAERVNGWRCNRSQSRSMR